MSRHQQSFQIPVDEQATSAGGVGQPYGGGYGYQRRRRPDNTLLYLFCIALAVGIVALIFALIAYFGIFWFARGSIGLYTKRSAIEIDHNKLAIETYDAEVPGPWSPQPGFHDEHPCIRRDAEGRCIDPVRSWDATVMAFGSRDTNITTIRGGDMVVVKAGKQIDCPDGPVVMRDFDDLPTWCGTYNNVVMLIRKMFYIPHFPGFVYIRGFLLAWFHPFLSDRVIKTDIEEYAPAAGLELVNSVPVRKYHYTEQWLDQTGKRNLLYHGFIAQEVEEGLPAAVETINEPIIDCEDCVQPTKTLSAERLIPELWAAVQELSAQLDAAKAEIAELKEPAQSA